jgi:hypothetical protein
MKLIFVIPAVLTTALLTACFSDTRFTEPKFAVSGKPLRLNFVWSMNPDCTVKGVVTVRMLRAPQHGQLSIDQGPGYSRFRPSNQRYPCNRQQTQGVVVSYISNAGYTGSDSATVEYIDPDGSYWKSEYAITVK